MKKSLKVAIAASVLATPAMAATNMENPLYLPSAGEVYSKTSAGMMYKRTDETAALRAKDHDNANEFPIWRLHEDIGYGITDRLAVHGSFGYTKAGDIDRKGMHQGRVGMTYRMFDQMGAIWDVYADAHLGGIGQMNGSYTATGFNYDNYSNGRWGFHVGTKMGNTWGNLTAAMFAEVLQTFGNDNNEIDVTALRANPAFAALPDNIAVDLKSTTEFNAGLKTMYQFDTRWSMGASFTFKHHANNGVQSVSTDLPGVPQAAVDGLLAQLADMQDGFDEYIIGVSGAYQMSENTQVVLYGEYTMDTAQPMSQNGSDAKAEIGVRLNVRF
ncbi:hypothetical protein LJC18_03945 [Lachnospiraceae bacterium OttesenSCG-928-E19]|nr:hypothetical protein [Lachnospiraceae bacterium OttesenSCG-928-E19]